MNSFYLVIANELGDYRIISGYSKLFDLDESYVKKEGMLATSMESIIDFTTKFSGKEELTAFLNANNLLPQGEDFEAFKNGFDYRILVVKKDGTKRILEGGIVYPEDLYLYDPVGLINYFQGHVTDSTFMQLFNAEFYEKYGTVAKFKNSLGYLYDSWPFRNIKRAQERMEYFVKSFISFEDENKVDYAKIRKLAVFAIYYRDNYEFGDLGLTVPKNSFFYNEYSELLLEKQHCEALLLSSATEEEAEIYRAKIEELRENIRSLCRRR